MLFIYPMWDSQSQRVGMLRCSKRGYMFQEVARILGSLGLFLLLGMFIYLIARSFLSDSTESQLWILSIPFGIGIMAQILYLYGWSLAYKKKFEYDDEKREASWEENGKRITYSGEKENNVPVI
jgi:hypothetical protein